MSFVSDVQYGLAQVFGRPAYRNLALLGAVVALPLTAVLSSAIAPYALLRGEFLINPFLTVTSVVFLLAFSVLAGVAVALAKARYDLERSLGTGAGLAGFAGIFAGCFTAACPVCGPLLFYLLGITASFTALPLGGLEIQLASLGLLALSTAFTARSINNSARCAVPQKIIGG